MCCRCCNIKTAAKQPSQFKKNWMKYRIPLTIFGILHIILAVIIALAEFANELQDFWYTNVFGGFWVSFILFITTVVLFVSVYCNGSTKWFLLWNILNTIALLVLIGFDIAFLIDPSICLLPLSSCTSQATLNSFHYVIPPVVIYTQVGAKRLYRYIQIGCVGLALIFSVIFFVLYYCSKPNGQVGLYPSPDPTLQKKVKQPEPPAIVASMEYISDEMLKPPKDSQLPPWPIVGPTIGPILGAPPPF
ncbi:unnamed protein product [Rotaria magnacalcarata]|uniref:Uncharacterized protein n=1 Tax=Rotaria magnacalcarata TaxID=392030 RepID=A0A8S2QWI5_9BILA|nr:unnamed protein product [Rotaria magnacalcarata]